MFQYSLLRKSPWKCSTDIRKGVSSKLIMVFKLNFPFICNLSRICNRRHLHSCMRYGSHQKNRLFYVEITEAVVRGCSVEKVFLETSQNLQESTCARLFFNKKRKNLWHRCFRVNFAKFLRTPFFTENLRRLLLK